MSNNVQSHADAAEQAAGEDRRVNVRHAAHSLGSVTARIIGGSQVDLINFSNRGVLFECDSRLLIGARASVRITTTDANLVVTGRVVRSRVKGLINGALRYDAALVLDAELGLSPTFIDAPAAGSADLDDLVAFESQLDATFDPSPVEAYLAESEASLLEVAPEADLPFHAATAEPLVDVVPHIAPETAAMPPPLIPAALSPAGLSALGESAGQEPVAFEAEPEIAFEPAVEFAFDEGGEAALDLASFDAADEGTSLFTIEPVEPAVSDEPAGTSIFDATYMPPIVDDVVPAESQFQVTPPTAAFRAVPSSLFDPRPSQTYGEGRAAEVAAFAAVDGVALDAAPVLDEAVAADQSSARDAASADVSTPDEPAFAAATLDDLDQSPAAVPETEDRVLLQFAATVPHDLAELRRIAADNQW